MRVHTHTHRGTHRYLIGKLLQIYRRVANIVERIPYYFYLEAPIVNCHICFIICPPTLSAPL